MRCSLPTLSVIFLLLLFGTAYVTSATADIPKIINYQGKATNTNGALVADGTYTMQFGIFDSESGGTALWSSGTVSVQVDSGIFAVTLGESP